MLMFLKHDNKYYKEVQLNQLTKPELIELLQKAIEIEAPKIEKIIHEYYPNYYHNWWWSKTYTAPAVMMLNQPVNTNLDVIKYNPQAFKATDAPLWVLCNIASKALGLDRAPDTINDADTNDFTEMTVTW